MKQKAECGIEYEIVTNGDVIKYRLNNGIELDHMPTTLDIKTNNLVTFSNMTEKEQKERIKKMTENSVKSREQRKTFKESAEKWLQLKATKDDILAYLSADMVEKIPSEYKNSITLQDVIVLRNILESLGGSERHSVFVRDTVGDKPTEKAEIRADVISDSDRLLIEKLQKRLESGAE